MSIQRQALFEKRCEAQNLTCGICLDPYRSPMAINKCLHVFCKTCVEPLDHCPTCRVEFKLKHLKADFDKAERVEVVRQEYFSDEKAQEKVARQSQELHKVVKVAPQLNASPCKFTISYLTGKVTRIEEKTTMTVRQLEEYIEHRDGVPVWMQRLIFNGRRINATPTDLSKTLSELGVQEGSKLQMVLAMRG